VRAWLSGISISSGIGDNNRMTAKHSDICKQAGMAAWRSGEKPRAKAKYLAKIIGGRKWRRRKK